MAEVLKSLDPRQRNAFKLARTSAKGVLRRRMRLFRLLRDAYRKLARNEDALTRVRGDLLHLLRMARAWARKEYRAVPWRTMLYVVAAIIYFVNPVDLIPDALVGLGFLDDAAVISAVVRALQSDIQKYLSWEAAAAASDVEDDLEMAA